ncbi:basic blue protein-like [Chenopodium quinoa]|uniref:basic blue protein-like n=1 Tax=Chenopodium quinoa TaxID=63459 RepID=UPI000B798E34|nr:basic blue protein-like [Chenopodium quinoa]
MEGLKRMSMMVVVVLMVLIAKEVSATQHVVGGSDGWDETTDYDSWAKSQTFKVGDTLVFKYTPGLHSVMELGSESEYKKCDTSNAANSMNGGNDVVKLDKAGTRFFTCGTAGHCGAGMKLKVNVVGATGSSSSSSPSSSSSSSTSDVSTAYQSLLRYTPIMSSLSLAMTFLPMFVL